MALETRNGDAVTIEQINEQIFNGNQYVRVLFTGDNRGFYSYDDNAHIICSSVLINAGSDVRVVEGGRLFTFIKFEGKVIPISIDPDCIDYVAW